MKRREFIALLGSVAAFGPHAASAQQTARPLIGFLRGGSLAASAHIVESFRQGLKETGLVDGQNAEIEYQPVEDQTCQLPGLVAELVRRKVA